MTPFWVTLLGIGLPTTSGIPKANHSPQPFLFPFYVKYGCSSALRMVRLASLLPLFVTAKWDFASSVSLPMLGNVIVPWTLLNQGYHMLVGDRNGLDIWASIHHSIGAHGRVSRSLVYVIYGNAASAPRFEPVDIYIDILDLPNQLDHPAPMVSAVFNHANALLLRSLPHLSTSPLPPFHLTAGWLFSGIPCLYIEYSDSLP